MRSTSCKSLYRAETQNVYDSSRCEDARAHARYSPRAVSTCFKVVCAGVESGEAAPSADQAQQLAAPPPLGGEAADAVAAAAAAAGLSDVAAPLQTARAGW